VHHISTHTLSCCFAIAHLLTRSPMLQVAAGAKMISGSTIGTKQYQDARQRLKIWVEGDYAWTCLWQSARYLRQALFADWGIYTPWAVYLTTVSFPDSRVLPKLMCSWCTGALRIASIRRKTFIRPLTNRTRTRSICSILSLDRRKDRTKCIIRWAT